MKTETLAVTLYGFNMGDYIICTNCGNKKEGTKIYRCNRCNLIFCSACDVTPGIFSVRGNICPNCRTEYSSFKNTRTVLGYIVR